MRTPAAIAFGSRAIRIGVAAVSVACLLASCAPSQDQNELVTLAESQASAMEAQGLRFQAMAYDDPVLAGSAFGFDIRAAGLLPVRFTLQNRSVGTVKVIPRQTFLIDQDGQAWPLLTSEQASNRLGRGADMTPTVSEKHVLESTDSFTAFALDLVAGSALSAESRPLQHKDNHVSQRFSGKGLRNPGVLAGQSASALLFFPGSQEIHGVRGLRIGYEQAGRLAFLTLPLKYSAISSQ